MVGGIYNIVLNMKCGVEKHIIRVHKTRFKSIIIGTHTVFVTTHVKIIYYVKPVGDDVKTQKKKNCV